jgi:hypothetical protein
MKDEGGNAKWSLERTLDEAILARHVTGQRGGPPMRCGPCDVSGGKRSKLPSALNGGAECTPLLRYPMCRFRSTTKMRERDGQHQSKQPVDNPCCQTGGEVYSYARTRKQSQ